MARKIDTDAPAENFKWDAASAQETSTTHLEDDVGYGKAVVIRQFTFAVNSKAFKENKPTKQELFNYHLKQIEIMLWQDGLKLMTDVEPRLTLDKKKRRYTIFVGSIPARGQLLTQTPQLLKELV